MEKWKKRAKKLKTETYALFLAYKDPRTPWYAKVFIACVIAYALSPIDLIPDFIPILGLLDDLILLPIGVTIAIKMIPASVLKECRAIAEKTVHGKLKKKWSIGIIIVVIWLCLLSLLAITLGKRLKR